MRLQVHPVLAVHRVRKAYGHVIALEDVSIEVRPGVVHAVCGDNGAGKSTLLKIISGATQPDEGDIAVDGRTVTLLSPRDAQDAGISTVYQDLALAPALTPADNFFLGREITRPGILGRLGLVDRRAMRSRTEQQLGDLGIRLPSLETPVESLSGGQRQALAIARAVTWGQRLLVLDEPTAALGATQTNAVLDLIRRTASQGLGVLFVSHDLPQVLEIADVITVLRRGQVVFTRATTDVSRDALLASMSGLQEVTS